MAETLYATFDDASLAEKAVGALLDYGVRNEDMTVLSMDPRYVNYGNTTLPNINEPIVNNTSPDYKADTPTRMEKAGKNGISTTTAGDAEVGAAKGAGIGLGLGIAAAIACIAVPGFGLVMGGGALATAIAGAVGATAAGAVAGGVTGYLKDQGVPDAAATNYHRAYENGAAILAVTTPSANVSQADILAILGKYQATNVNTFDNALNYAGRV